MSKVLVLEKTGSIRALLTQHFSGCPSSVDAASLIGEAQKKLKQGGYDVLIWDAVVPKTEQSAGLELLHRLTKDSSRTYIIVVTDQETDSLPLDRLRAYAHRTLMRPVHEDDICALISQALHQQGSSSGG